MQPRREKQQTWYGGATQPVDLTTPRLGQIVEVVVGPALPEGLAVNDWVLGGSGDLTALLHTMLGQHLGDHVVAIATCFGGGTLSLHRPVPGGAPGHTELFTADVGPFPADTLDALLSDAGFPLHLLDLRTIPTTGPVADRLAQTTSIMNGAQPQPIDPRAAFDAVVFIGSITLWHAFPTA